MHPRIAPEGSNRTPGRHHLELLKTELLQSLFNTICELLNFRFPKADAGDQSHWGKWESCARYMAHVESVKAHFESISIRVKSENGTLNVAEVFLDLIQNSAWYQYEIGNYQECLDLSLFGTQDVCLTRVCSTRSNTWRFFERLSWNYRETAQLISPACTVTENYSSCHISVSYICNISECYCTYVATYFRQRMRRIHVVRREY